MIALEIIKQQRNEEMNWKTGNKFILIFLLILLMGMTGCQFSKQGQEDEPPAVTDEEGTEQTTQEQEEEEEPPQPVVTSATVAAIGDVLIHQSIYRDAKTGDTYDFDKMFTEVTPYLQAADITIANQESMIGGAEMGLSTYPQFNSPFEVGDALKHAGVDVVSIANNHTLDRGEEAIMNATNHWDALGIPYVGAYKSAEDRAKIRTLERNDITFSFLSYTYGTNGIPVPEGKPYLVNLIDKEQIKADIASAKQQSDVIVVSLHFGNEYERLPNEQQKELVQFVADQGAHLIIGHHPHVLQTMEYVQSAEGHEAFVIYSLGNFLAAQEAKDDQYRRIGGILQVEVEKTESENESTMRILSPSFLPTYIAFKNWKNYKIIPMQQLTDNQLANAQQHYKEIKEHVSQSVPVLDFMEDSKKQ